MLIGSKIRRKCIFQENTWPEYCMNVCQLAMTTIQYIPRNMHTVFALLCFVVVIHWLIFPYPSGLLHWHCGNLTIAPVPAKQPWWIWKKYFMWIHYERLHNHNKAKHNKTVCIFLGIYCILHFFQEKQLQNFSETRENISAILLVISQST